MKRVLSFILVLAMVLSSFGMAFAAPASDIAGHKNEDAILRLNKLGIVKGDDRGFAPDDNITRAEFAVLLVRALGLESSANLAKGDTQFTDVTMTNGYDWATGAINVATKLGYIQGYGAGKFGPADNIRYEDAITLIVRVLGYEPAAQDKGGYPVGYLVVAEQELDITDNTTAVAGVAATRGTVFQLLDNALTEPMMIQVGYGTDKKYVVSGTEDTKVRYLFDQLGFDRYEDRLIDFDAEDLEITFAGKTLNVEEGFDFEEARGVELIVWADGKDVVTYELNEKALFDALEVTKTEEEIKLVDANKKYEVNKNTIVFIDGEQEDFEALEKGDKYNYAKVVLDGKEVVFVSAYDLADFIVVEEVDDAVISQYDGEELDVEDYTIVKDGKTISVDDLEEGDILFYNDKVEYAEVYNNGKEGAIERIYEDEVKLAGKVYSFLDANYLDAGEFAPVDVDALKEMEEEDKDVEFFLNRAGKLVLIIGTRAEVETNTFYGYVAEDTKDFDTRGKTNWTFDVLNEEGKVVKYDVTNKFATDFDGNWADDIKKGVVVAVTVDEDGDIDEVALLREFDITKDIEQGDKYAEGFRLQDNTVVFWAEGETAVKDYTVMTWAESADEFDIVEKGTLYVNSSDRVVAIVADQTDADVAAETLRGLVTKVRVLRGGDKLEITVEIEGTKQTFVTTKDATIDSEVDENVVVEIEVKDEEIVSATALTAIEVEVAEINRAKSTIKATNGKTYELVAKGVVYDATDKYAAIRVRDLVAGDTVKVYLVDGSARFADYIVLDELEVEIPEEPETPEEPAELSFTVSVEQSNPIVGYTMVVVELENLPEGKTAEDYSVTVDGIELVYGNGKFANAIQKVLTQEEATALTEVTPK